MRSLFYIFFLVPLAGCKTREHSASGLLSAEARAPKGDGYDIACDPAEPQDALSPAAFRLKVTQALGGASQGLAASTQSSFELALHKQVGDAVSLLSLDPEATGLIADHGRGVIALAFSAGALDLASADQAAAGRHPGILTVAGDVEALEVLCSVDPFKETQE